MKYRNESHDMKTVLFYAINNADFFFCSNDVYFKVSRKHNNKL